MQTESSGVCCLSLFLFCFCIFVYISGVKFFLHDNVSGGSAIIVTVQAKVPGLTRGLKKAI